MLKHNTVNSKTIIMNDVIELLSNSDDSMVSEYKSVSNQRIQNQLFNDDY